MSMRSPGPALADATTKRRTGMMAATDITPCFEVEVSFTQSIQLQFQGIGRQEEEEELLDGQRRKPLRYKFDRH